MLADVRAQPPNQDHGCDIERSDGDLPDMTAIIHALMLHSELITRNHMIYLIADNRQVPHYSAGVFVLEAARFLCPKQRFALIDNDCVPVTLFEMQDLIELAHRQLQWVDLVGYARAESGLSHGIDMLLFTEAHLEYNAGLVISIGSGHRSSPLERRSSSAMLAQELQECRLTLVSRARPPATPSEAAVNGTMFTPFVGVPMQNALDLCVVWSLYGLYACKNFWPCPKSNPAKMSCWAETHTVAHQLGQSHFRAGGPVSAPHVRRPMYSHITARGAPVPSWHVVK